MHVIGLTSGFDVHVLFPVGGVPQFFVHASDDTLGPSEHAAPAADAAPPATVPKRPSLEPTPVASWVLLSKRHGIPRDVRRYAATVHTRHTPRPTATPWRAT